MNPKNPIQSHAATNLNIQAFGNPFYQQYQQVINNNMSPRMMTQYNWNGVMEFLQEQLKNAQIKENEWLKERQQLIEKIEQLQTELASKDNEIQILNKKLKLIEYTLKMDRSKNTINIKDGYQPNHLRVRSDVVANLMNGQGDNIITNSITSSIFYSNIPGGNHNRRQKSSGGQILNRLIEEIPNNQTNQFHTQPSVDNFKSQKRTHHRQTNSFGGSSTQPLFIVLENHKKKSDDQNKLHYHSNHASNHCINNTTNNNNNNPGVVINQQTSLIQSNNMNIAPQNVMQMPNHTDVIQDNFNKLQKCMSSSTNAQNSLIISHQNTIHNVQSSSTFKLGITKSNNNSNQINLANAISSPLGSNNPNNPSNNNTNNPQMMVNPTLNSSQGMPIFNAPFNAKIFQQENFSQNLTNSSSFNHPSTIPENIQSNQNLKITPAQKLSLITSSTNKRKWIEEDKKHKTSITPSMIMNQNISENRLKPTNKYGIQDHKNIFLNESLEEIQQPHCAKKIIIPKTSLRSHMDGVRGVFFSSINPILASISEDCMIKLWDVRALSHANESSHIEPYYTLRYHSGPLFALSGSPDIEGRNTSLFTAGSEGIIRIWDIPHPDTVDCYGPCGKNNFCIGAWNAHQDVIWELNHHPNQNLLASSSADGTVKMWQPFDLEDTTESYKFSSGNILATFCFKNPNMQNLDTPTSMTWLTGNTNGLAIGYVFTQSIAIFDHETAKLITTLKYGDESNKSPNAQPNKLLANLGSNCIISAHEDKSIRFFDINSNKLIKSVIAHTDSVTNLSLKSTKNHLASVGHDGSLRIWDIRKYQCLHEIPAHRKKFDESIHSVIYHNNLELLATGGADGLIKIFEYCDQSQSCDNGYKPI